VSSRGSAKRQRQEALKAEARRGSRKGVRLFTVLLIGTVMVLIAVAFVFRGEGNLPTGPGGGAVWSAEHGHWH